MTSGIERRRTIRMRRSRMLECKLDALDKPAIKIAEDIEEFSKGFRLVYDEYRHMGYTGLHPSKMLYNVWSLLPTTSFFLFKSHLDVISTMAHIKDTPLFGLPMDVLYKDKLDELRARGRVVVEIGSLVTLRMRRWSNVMIFISRAVLQHARLTGVDDLVVMVNPKHVRFYSQILLFKPFAEERLYEKVGAPAVALRINLNEYEQDLITAYGENDFETDLHAFFNEFSDPLLPGDTNPSGKRRKILDPYSAYFFFRRRPEVLEELNDAQREYFAEIYHLNALEKFPDRPGADGFRSVVTPVLEQLRLEKKDDYTDIAFNRNLGLMDYAGQRKLLRTRVAIPGLGGVGGSHLITLARCGVGAFNLSDFDTYSPANINRQYGSDINSFGRSKLDVMIERALGANPFLDIRRFPDGVNKKNMDEFLEDVDVLVDSLDFFCQDIRRALFNRALERNIPVITAAPAGFSGSMLVFMPGGMNYDQYFGVNERTDPLERLIRFSLGVAPKGTHLRYIDRRFIDLREARVPSVDIGCEICAGMVATEVVNIALGRKPVAVIPASYQFDARRGILRKARPFRGMNNPWQKLKVAAALRLLIPPAPLRAMPPAKPETPPTNESIPTSILEYIARAGIQAPSGDNVQPWRFSFHPNQIEVTADRAADASFFNVAQAATLLSTGAAVQNMEYAAGALGIECHTELFPDDGSGVAARLRLLPQGLPFHELMGGVLWRRCTNRKLYSRKAVGDAVWKRVASIADEHGDALLQATSAPADLRRLAKAVYLADRVRVEREDLHRHLMEKIHFTPLPTLRPDEEAPEIFRTGMPLKNLQAGPMGEIYLRAVRSWGRMTVANAIGLGRVMPLYGGLGMIFSGGAGLLCANGDGEEAVLRAGRSLQRAWCSLELFGFSLQPMAALTLLNLRLRLEGEGAFIPRHVRLLREAWDIAASIFPVPEDRVPLLLFRAGKSTPPRHGTYRLNVRDLTTG